MQYFKTPATIVPLYGLKQERGPIMPYNVFCLEPDLGDLCLVDRATGAVVSKMETARFFQLATRASQSPVRLPELTAEIHFDTTHAPKDRVYWTEQSGVAAEVMQIMRAAVTSSC